MRFRNAAAIVLLVATLGACTGGSISQGAPTTTTPRPAVSLVVLGSDEAFGAGVSQAERNRSTWPQLVFRNALPARATLVNLATRGATAADVRDAQVPRALGLAPSIAIVWVTGDEQNGRSIAQYQSALTDSLVALRSGGVGQVVVVEGPSGHADDDAATVAAASASGATAVDLSALNSPLDSAASAVAAQAIAAAIGPIA